MKPRFFNSEAEAEYAEAAQYYADFNPKLGGRFCDEIERLIADVCKNPHLFRLHYPPVRRHFSGIFPYGILYVERNEGVWILAVMNLRRSPDYWIHRLR